MQNQGNKEYKIWYSVGKKPLEGGGRIRRE